MINWVKSAELNNCTVDTLKSWFERYPGSNKKIIRICDICGEEREIYFEHYCNLCVKCSNTNRSPEYRKALSDAAIKRYSKEMDPLPTGQTITISENKNCAQYLGCIAEKLLALTFKDVKRMPYSNPGFDLICNQDYKIDVKSSATGHLGHWMFNIVKNRIADYFLCIAFESRDELIPVHVWLIPSNVVNHRISIQISKSTIDRWSKYEKPIKRVLACCDVIKDQKVYKV